MKINKIKHLKSAVGLFIAMLIFSVSSPDYANITAKAEDDDINIIFEDDDDDLEDDDLIEDDPESEDDDTELCIEDGDQSDNIGPADENKKNKTIQEEEENEKLKSNHDDKKHDSKSNHKTHHKVKVSISKKASTYNEKIAAGDDLKITVKKRGHKVKGKKLKFSSSKKSVATVSKDGVITAIKKGTTKIKIKSKSNKKEKCTIIVTVTDSSVK